MKHYADTKRLARLLTSLPDLDRRALIEQWHAIHGFEPPANISRSLLIQAIAYRSQEQATGGLKVSTCRFLEKVAEAVSAGKSIPDAPLVIKPGIRLLREWHGTTYEVIVLKNGVKFQGKHYRSLSEVARTITGVRWSGPLFFGLKKVTT